MQPIHKLSDQPGTIAYDLKTGLIALGLLAVVMLVWIMLTYLFFFSFRAFP